MALKKGEFSMRNAGYKVSADEMDLTMQYQVINPGTSATWIGTAAGGTSTQAKALVLINKFTDYPRNLAYGLAGSADMGCVWTINGKNQFGETITESVTIGSAANGGTTMGTKVFAQVTSGTCTIETGAVGAGSGKIGLAYGTSPLFKFGLPVKIAAVTDVRNINYLANGALTTLNGGTITSSHVDTTYHAFYGTASLAITDTFVVRYRSTYAAEENYNNL